MNGRSNILRNSLLLCIAASASSLGTPAHAEDVRLFQANQFRPQPSQQTDYLNVNSAHTAGRAWDWEVGMMWNYARNPLVVSPVGESGRLKDETILRHQMVLDLMASVSFTEWLDVGIDFPLYLSQGGNGLLGVSDDVKEAGKPGDLRFVPSVNFYRRGMLALGGSIDVAFPTGRNQQNFESEGIRAEPRIALDWGGDKFRIGTNVGWHFRPAARLRNITVDDTLTAGVAGSIALHPKVSLVPEAVAGFSVLNRQSNDKIGLEEIPLEALLAVRYKPIPGLQVQAGGGGGIIEGFGTPDYRLFVGISYSSEPPVCPNFPKATEVGPCECDWSDDDGDGVLNCIDVCPGYDDNVDLNADGFPDGCGPCDWKPGMPDVDNDGIVDSCDMCPAGDDNVDVDQDMCPDACDICPPFSTDPTWNTDDRFDSDADQIPDGCDVCPGGPDNVDSDEDCIPDACDQCPDEAETWNRLTDEDGCPELVGDVDCKADLIPLVEGEMVHFNFDLDVVREDDNSMLILDQLSAILFAHPELLLIRVEGHTDSFGSDSYNQDLSARRAKAVVQELVKRGIADTRVYWEGFGESRLLGPDDPEDSSAAPNALNRRVEFHIVEADCPQPEGPELIPPPCQREREELHRQELVPTFRTLPE